MTTAPNHTSIAPSLVNSVIIHPIPILKDLSHLQFNSHFDSPIIRLRLYLQCLFPTWKILLIFQNAAQMLAPL